MPELTTIKRARRDKRRGKSPSTQAGEFVREELRRIRARKRGARARKQAIAIGLAEARRAGVKLRRPPARAKAATKRRARLAMLAAVRARRRSLRRSRARVRTLKREARRALALRALARQARAAAKKRRRRTVARIVR